jgi:Sec63 Brl domain
MSNYVLRRVSVFWKVLQMIGRAGRPGFDTTSVAVVMVVEDKKIFYKKVRPIKRGVCSTNRSHARFLLFLAQFLYTPFPVESCFEHRINENINAELVSGTIKSLVDCVGYLTWTFFARRVKGNPQYYGAMSNSVERVEARLLTIAKETVERLISAGCVDAKGDDQNEFSELLPTSLGTAASQYYLRFRTPKQMQLGVREGRKTVVKALEGQQEHLLSVEHVKVLKPFVRSKHVDEKSIAWLLFALCSTHEFDELPVRHNEEFLNQELSANVTWGPDTADVLSDNDGQRQYRNIEIFADPHTKAFLLIQAYLEHTKLPISDYINDTKSIVENVPRLLSAMAFVAASESGEAGSFELLTQFSRTRQLFEARCRFDDDPLAQVLGSNFEQPRKGANAKRHCGSISLFELRGMNRKDALSNVQTLLPANRRGDAADDAVNKLFSLPGVRLLDAVIGMKADKATGASEGNLRITLEIERFNNKRNDRSHDGEAMLTLTILVGSFQQQFLLAQDVIRLNRFGTWTVTKELVFDWAKANADGGENGGRVVVRLLFDEIRGLDAETIVMLN